MKYRFRVWDKDFKKMRSDMNFSGVIGWKETLNDLLSSDGFVFMKNLGLKDKNGKEMWEGDIVKTWDATGGLCFGGKTFVLGYHTYFNNPLYVEVVGNEWENPELVELR